MKTLYVIDIDATLADATERIRRAGPEPSRSSKKAYQKWVRKVNKGMEGDVPVPGMSDLVSRFDSDHAIYLTSRDDEFRDATRTWLTENGFPLLGLIMRPAGSYVEGVDFKEIAINTLYWSTQCKSVVVLDDDGKGDIELMCKRNGWTFLKARSGGQK